jgi:hypothetical protein
MRSTTAVCGCSSSHRYASGASSKVNLRPPGPRPRPGPYRAVTWPCPSRGAGAPAARGGLVHPRADRRDQRQPVVVELLTEPHVRRAALVEAGRHDCPIQSAQSGRREGLLQRPSDPDTSMATSTPAPPFSSRIRRPTGGSLAGWLGDNR